jgi:twitching motility protein PilT
MVPTPAVRNLIREGKTHQLYSALQTGGQHGMQTMDAALVDLVRAGKLTQKQAEGRSSTPDELKRLLGDDGSTAGAGVTMAPPQPQVSIGPPPTNGGPSGSVSIGRPPNGRGI